MGIKRVEVIPFKTFREKIRFTKELMSVAKIEIYENMLFVFYR